MGAKQDRLLLFDIDCTLLNTGGAGMNAFHSAVEDLYSDKLIGGNSLTLDMAGSTDSGLVIEIFKSLEIQDSEQERKLFFEAYLSRLKLNLSSSKFAGSLLPGVEALLGDLSVNSQYHGVYTGLLTGNLEEGAKMKVEHFGIGEHFTFGAYGCDHHDRNKLGPIALERAYAKYDRNFDPENVIVIGDTPKDIKCAKAFGAKVLAVSTGSFTCDELSHYEPDFVIEDLSDQQIVRSILISN
tara:strand:+ start:1784 stop:2503 length:720 start_codon:yes stop_codon:yes gene_type:complete